MSPVESLPSGERGFISHQLIIKALVDSPAQLIHLSPEQVPWFWVIFVVMDGPAPLLHVKPDSSPNVSIVWSSSVLSL